MSRMILMFIAVAIFIVLCWALAIFYNKRTKSLDDYLVSGRSVGFWVLMGSWIGGSFGGSSVAGYLGYGWASGLLEFMALLPAFIFSIIFIAVFAKKLSILGSKYHLVSIPDFLALRFGNSIRVPSVLFVFFRMGFIVGLQCLALGLVFQIGFGISLYAGMAIGFVVLVGYVCIGGMMASIVVEWIQSILQSIVMIAIPLIAIFMISGGNPIESFNLAQTTLTGTEGFSFNPLDLPGNMMLNYFLCMGFYYLADQWSFQRVFAASDPDVANKALNIGNVLCVFFSMLPFLSGILLRTGAEIGAIAIPLDIASDQVFFHFVINVLPTGASVFFLVCYLAAVLSCGSSFLMGGVPLIVNDVYKSFINPGASQKQLVKVGRLGVGIVAVFGIVGALAIPNLVVLFQMGNVFTACGVLIPVCAAFFWKRATKLGGIMSCWIGGLAGLFFCIYSLNTGGDYMLMANGFPVVVAGLLASLIALIVFSLIQKPDPEEVVNMTLYSKLSSEEN